MNLKAVIFLLCLFNFGWMWPFSAEETKDDSIDQKGMINTVIKKTEQLRTDHVNKANQSIQLLEQIWELQLTNVICLCLIVALLLLEVISRKIRAKVIKKAEEIKMKRQNN